MRRVGVGIVVVVWLAAAGPAHAQLEPGEEEEVVEDYTRPGSPAPPQVEEPKVPESPEIVIEPEPEPQPEPEPELEPQPQPKPQPQPQPEPKPQPQPKPQPRPKAAPAVRTVAVHVFGAELLPGRALVLGRAISAGLDPARWRPLAPAGAPAPADEDLAAADQELEKARALQQDLDLPGADAALARAARRYERSLLPLIARDGGLGKLADVYRLLALGRFLDGDEEAARAMLGHVFVLEPHLVYDKKLFPPDMKQLVTEERAAFDAAAPGTVEVSAPAGLPATVFLDGQNIGAAPVRVEGVSVGPHYVTLSAEGVPPWTDILPVAPGETARLDAEPPAPTGPHAEALAAAEPEVGAAAPGPKLRAAHAALGAPDALLMVRVTTGDDGALELHAYLYDMTAGKLAREASVSILDPAVPGERPAELARASTSESVTPPPRGPRPAPWYERAYRHRYFWPAVGAAAGVVLVGVVVGAASSGLSPGERLVVLFSF